MIVLAMPAGRRGRRPERRGPGPARERPAPNRRSGSAIRADPVLAHAGRPRRPKSHRCVRSGPTVACPADRQTAYQVQVASGERGALTSGNLLWDSGKVTSDQQVGIPYGGPALASRQQVSWRVRVWDADGAPSNWSAGRALRARPAGAGRLGQRPLDRLSGSDRVASRCPSSRASSTSTGNVAKARLYLSGIGVQLATRQRPVADRRGPRARLLELAACRRVPHLRRHRRARGGSNTVGVQLGNGTAYVRRSVTNPARRPHRAVLLVAERSRAPARSPRTHPRARPT